MNLLERIQARLCAEPDCKRAPAYPDQRYCAEHRVRWMPEWRRNLEASDKTGWVKAA
jgi:hypothetical protein